MAKTKIVTPNTGSKGKKSSQTEAVLSSLDKTLTNYVNWDWFVSKLWRDGFRATCMAAASRQWWKVSTPPEVASRLVCHKAPFLDLCSFSYITVTFHQWHLPAQLCLPMTLSCMTAVLTAQISAIVVFLRTLNASATGLINGTQRLTPANQCTCFSTFANQNLGRCRYWLWVLSRSPSRSEHAILVWCWHRA